MSLEEAADNRKVMTTNKTTRAGLPDDTYAVAEPEDLASLLEELKIELQACGHLLRMQTCKVWFPGWDDTGDDDLPQEARVLLQRIPRSARGLVCGDWTGTGDSKRQAVFAHDETT